MDVPESCVQSLELKGPKSTCLSARNICVLLAQGRKRDKKSFKGIARALCTEVRRENEQEGSTGQLPLMPSAPRLRACVWLSRAGRLMRADPTQLREGKKPTNNNYMTLILCHELPEGSYISCSLVSTWTSPPIFQRVLKNRVRTHLVTCRQTLVTGRHMKSSSHENDFSRKQNPEAAKSATACLRVPTRRHLRKRKQSGARVTALEVHFEKKTGKHAFQKTCRSMHAFVDAPGRENTSIHPNRRRSRTT